MTPNLENDRDIAIDPVDLGAKLAAQVPQLPGSHAEWPDRARTGARRRRRGAIAGQLAAVVLLTAGGVGIVTQRDRGVPAEPVVAAPATASPPGCEGTVTEPSRLDQGVVGIRLCDTGGDGLPLAAPPDELVLDPGRVVEVYNSLPKVGRSQSCTATGGPGYRLVLRYPDGHVVRIQGGLGGCGDVGSKTSAKKLSDAFVAALQDQRTTRPAPASVTKNPCSGPRGSWMPLAPADLVRATLCLPQGPVELTAEQWALVRADLAVDSNQAGESGSPTPLAAQDAAGEPVFLWWAGSGIRLDDRVFELSDESVQTLTGVVEAVTGPEAKRLCGLTRGTAAINSELDLALADCTEQPRLLPPDAAGSVGKLVQFESKPGKLPTGTVRTLVLVDDANHAVELTLGQGRLAWRDPASGAVRTIVVEDWLAEQLD